MPETGESVEIRTGLDADPRYTTFLERFFEEINDEAARGYTYTVARQGDEIVGVAATLERDEVEHAKLAFLHVAEEHQRRGIATRLVEEVCRETEKSELLAKPHVAWWEANEFYARTGWTREEERSSGMLTAYVRNCE